MKLDWKEPESKPTHKPDSIRKLKQASNPSFLLYAYVFLKPPLYHPSCTFPPRVPPFLLSALSDHFLPKKESSIAAITFPLLCPKKKKVFFCLYFEAARWRIDWRVLRSWATTGASPRSAARSARRVALSSEPVIKLRSLFPFLVFVFCYSLLLLGLDSVIHLIFTLMSRQASNLQTFAQLWIWVFRFFYFIFPGIWCYHYLCFLILMGVYSDWRIMCVSQVDCVLKFKFPNFSSTIAFSLFWWFWGNWCHHNLCFLVLIGFMVTWGIVCMSTVRLCFEVQISTL